ncbi:MAG TPA: hypothetical protein VFA41_06945 [Ktedonobacteraceae bacterium]|jgi:hypothetical protein|nr:hypothetical protein [Ktedonobacteraceae bacterium]
MQLLGILIFIGILVLLLAAAMYFGNTQKTPNRRSGSALDDLYSSKGMGNVINANEVIRENLSSGEKRRRQKQK